MAKRVKRAKKGDSEENLSFEDALQELNEVVQKLEDGTLTLDESLSQYERGIRQLKQCQKLLHSAERKIEMLSGFDADGNPVTHRFDDQELSLQQKAEKRSKRRSASKDLKEAETTDKLDINETLF